MEDLKKRIVLIKQKLDLDKLKKEISEIEALSTDPNFWQDHLSASEKMKRLGELQKDLQEIEELVVTDSTVYPILTRLRKDGYLKVRVAPSGEGPPRRYFSLTVVGQQRLQEMNIYWRNLQAAIERLQHGDRREKEHEHLGRSGETDSGASQGR